MYTLQVENFQSIKNETFKLSGFTAITGPSNLGKSAVRRALGVIMYNYWDASWLRKDEKDCTLTLSKDNGDFTITVKKPDNSFKIERKGKETLEFGKVGRNVPDEIKEMGFNTVSLPDEELMVNISKQLDPLFMVSYKDTSNTVILNQLFNVTKLEQAAGMASRDRRASVTDSNRIKEEYVEKKKELDTLDLKITDVEKTVNKANKLLEEYTLVTEFLESSERKHELETLLSPIDSNLSKNKELVNLSSDLLLTTEYVTLVNDQSEATDSLATVTKRVSSLVENKEELRIVSSYLYWSDLKEENQPKLDTVSTRLTSLVSHSDGLPELSSYLDLVQTKNDLSIESSKVNLRIHNYPDFEALRSVSNFLINSQRVTDAESEIAPVQARLDRVGVSVGLSEELSLVSSYLDDVAEDHRIALEVEDILVDIDEQKKIIAGLPKCNTCGQLIGEEHNHV